MTNANVLPTKSIKDYKAIIKDLKLKLKYANYNIDYLIDQKIDAKACIQILTIKYTSKFDDLVLAEKEIDRLNMINKSNNII